MDIGMLWSVSDRKLPLADQVREAADYYRAKYNREPTECWAHPMAIEAAGGLAWVDAIRICGSRTIARGELWIGVGKTVKVI